MIVDVAISCDMKYGKPSWGLYYAPQYEGPKTGDLFNAGEGEEMDVHRTKYHVSSTDKDGELFKLLQALTECEGYPITSKLYETPVQFYEEEPF